MAAINTCVLFTFEPLSLSTRLSPPLASPFAAKGRYPRVASLTARKESLPNQNIHTRILFFVAWKTALDISLIYSDTSPLFPPSPLFFLFLANPQKSFSVMFVSITCSHASISMETMLTAVSNCSRIVTFKIPRCSSQKRFQGHETRSLKTINSDLSVPLEIEDKMDVLAINM